MKRKSILMTIVAVLFASIAWGQTTTKAISVPLPKASDFTDKTGTKFKYDNKVIADADTIYFCASVDSIYPIEFGYDVSGRRLHPSYGDWHVKAKTDSAMAVLDYDFNTKVKNGGAGNAFSAVGSGIGGILFEYTAKDKQCGLDVEESFWVYVFILPLENKPVTKADSFICYTPNTTTTPIEAEIDFTKVFAKYSEDVVGLYPQAGLAKEWAIGSTVGKVQKIRTDSVATYILKDTLFINKDKKQPSYTCGDTVLFSFKIRVDSVARDTIPKAYSICVTDTMGDLGQRDVKSIFGRNLKNGFYTPAKIMPWPGDGADAKASVYTYTYTLCNYGTGPDVTRTISDTLKILEPNLLDDSIGMDTLIHCRRETTIVPIIDFYSKGEVWYTNKPVFSESNTDSYWADRGIYNKKNPSKGTGPADSEYGTISGDSSLVNGYYLNIPDMVSNVGYYYRWNVDASIHECFVDATGNPGFGDLVILLQDPFIAQDYTVQVCQDSYTGDTDEFDFKEYTGIVDVKWYNNADKQAVKTPYTSIMPKGMLKSTYKYNYEASGDCAEGKGVLYVKITSNVKVKHKTVKYCKSKLPGVINLNDVLGVAVKGLTWSSNTSLNADSGFDANAGTLNIGTFMNSDAGKSLDTNPGTFQVTSSSCGVPASTDLVTIKFVTDL